MQRLRATAAGFVIAAVVVACAPPNPPVKPPAKGTVTTSTVAPTTAPAPAGLSTSVRHDGVRQQAPARVGGLAGNGGTGALEAAEAADPEVDPSLGASPQSIIGIESVVGADDRARVADTTQFPQRSVVLIAQEGAFLCTGWMVGPRTVITAGHCVYDRTTGTFVPPSSLVAYPGFDGDRTPSDPFGGCRARATFTTAGWVDQGDDRYDYGALALDCSVGDQTGWMGVWVAPESDVAAVRTAVLGYPSDKARTMWRSDDQVRASHSRRLFYGNDTVAGNSGSPIATDRVRGASGCEAWCALGVHAYGISPNGSGPAAQYNHGVRITQDVADNLALWRSA